MSRGNAFKDLLIVFEINVRFMTVEENKFI